MLRMEASLEAVPSRELELLILATRLQLSQDQEVRMAGLLSEEFNWASLLEQARPFGMLPMLHHHLTRPGLVEYVPDAVQQALAQEYQRTSMKNLRLLGLLRRILLKARDAGIPLVLLKGAYLAKWVYGDVGLRPMSDLDLFCRKEDEASLSEILRGMGAFQSDTPGLPDPALHPVRVAVGEKVGHPSPWWFPEICRVEIHFHLLARGTVDDTDLLEGLWSGTASQEWDGLEARSLGADHLLIHLAAHLHKHLAGELFNLYWLADIREVTRSLGATLDRPALAATARRIGVEQECAMVFGLLGEAWDAGLAVLDEATSTRRIAAQIIAAQRTLAHGPRGAGLLDYWSIITDVKHVRGVINKAIYIRELFLPPAWKMAARYNTTNRLLLPFLYLADPFVRLYAAALGMIHHVQRRLGY